MTTVRSTELQGMTFPSLCALFRALGYIGGKHPLEKWSKPEVINGILERQPHALTGCDVCRKPGRWCGNGGVVHLPRPCILCGEPTSIRSLCGAPRTGICGGRDEIVVEIPRTPAPTRPTATQRPARGRSGGGRAGRQEWVTQAAIAGLDRGKAPKLLDALEGPFTPTRGGRGPYWRPPLPGITWSVHVQTGYRWRRPYTGPVAVLDRSGAWVAAMSSVDVAHGPLEHTGPIEFDGAPGYYEIGVYPWYEPNVMPSPLGNVRGETVWVPAPRVGLLKKLVAQSRWPDVDVLDSYTCPDKVRLTEWTGHVNALRAWAINEHGRDSEQYPLVKEAFGQAMSLMLGSVDDGVRRTWKTGIHRPDWTHHGQEQASCTLWWLADEFRQVVPELGPVGLRHVDELLVPADAVPILTTTPRPGGKKPLQLDPMGVKLGSFKLKGTEEWTG